MTDSAAFLPSAHSPHRSSSKGGDGVSAASQRKDSSAPVSLGPLFMLMIALFGREIWVSIGAGEEGPLPMNEPLFCQQRSSSGKINRPRWSSVWPRCVQHCTCSETAH